MLLKDKTIFILGFSRFDSVIESTSFASAKFLARDNNVFYIDSPYTLKDYISKRSSGEQKQFERRKGAFFSLDKCLFNTDYKKLKVLILPPVVSKNFLPGGFLHRALLNLNEAIITSRVKSIIKRQNITDFIFINSFNFHYPNIGQILKPRLKVYHCVDPLVVDYDRKHGIISEKKLVHNSDLIICTSKKLFDEKLSSNHNTYFIPNAADFGHCSKALRSEVRIHKKLAGIRRPIIGYFGNIERRIDFELLSELALCHADKSFVFVGPVDSHYVPSEFRKLPNVFFPGAIPYNEMPSAVKAFDVAIIPFKKDSVSATIFPLKLFEYLGAGKPVVATDFNPDLKEFTANSVLYCRTSSEFSNALNIAIELGQNELHLKHRLFVASQNTWEIRLTEFSELLSVYYLKSPFKNKWNMLKSFVLYDPSVLHLFWHEIS